VIFAQDLQRFVGGGAFIMDKVVDPLLPCDQLLFPPSRLFSWDQESMSSRTTLHKLSKLRLEYAVLAHRASVLRSTALQVRAAKSVSEWEEWSPAFPIKGPTRVAALRAPQCAS
jgi:hypothetical protein